MTAKDKQLFKRLRRTMIISALLLPIDVAIVVINFHTGAYVDHIIMELFCVFMCLFGAHLTIVRVGQLRESIRLHRELKELIRNRPF